MNAPKRTDKDRFLSISMSLAKITPMPEFKEMQGKPYIYFGVDNKWPDTMLDLFKTASDHRAIVQGKSRYIAGKGIQFPEGIAVPPILKQANRSETFHDVICKAAKDWELFRGFYIRVRFDRMGNPSRMWHVPYFKVRSNQQNSRFYLCDKWGDRKEEREIEELDSLETCDKTKDCLYSWYDYDPSGANYSIPEYVAAIPYLSIDTETANFHETNVTSGFTAGTMLTMFRGEPEANEKREIDAKIKAKTTGSGKAGEVLVYYADEDEKKPEIDALRSNDLDKQYLSLADLVQQKTFTAHNITSGMLFGIKTPRPLGGADTEMQFSWDLLDANYIQPQQETIIKAFTNLFNVCGTVVDFSIQKLQPVIRDIVTLMDKGLVAKEYVQEQLGLPAEKTISQTPQVEAMKLAISSLSPLLAQKVLDSLTDDEVRSMAGLGPKLPSPTPASPLATATQMSEEVGVWNDEADLLVFAEFGELETDYILLDKTAVALAETLNKDGQKVLKAISENKYTSLKELAAITGIEIKSVTDYIEELTAKKLIQPNPSGGGGMIVTPTGQLEVDQKGPNIVLIETKWKYQGPKDEKNRPFCAKLMEMGRIYTREDITGLSARLGYDVWKRRGGWYRVPGSDPALNIPHCRHDWEQVIVRRRNK